MDKRSPERLFRADDARLAWRRLLQLEAVCLLILLAAIVVLIAVGISYGRPAAALHDAALIIFGAFVLGAVLHRFRHLREDMNRGGRR